MMIKINSDNRDGFAVENDHKPEIEFIKVDKADHNKKLSGAVFEIYSAKPSGEWTYEPGEKLGQFTTGPDGKFTASLDYGTYFWREISAPSGYKPADYDYHKFRVIKGLPQNQFVIENEAVPDTPGGGGKKYLLEITKISAETGDGLAGAHFEIRSAEASEDGTAIVPGNKISDENVITGDYGKVTVSLDNPGTYFYREVKSPEGYKIDSTVYSIEIKDAYTVEKVISVNEKEPEVPEPLEPPEREKEKTPEKPQKPNIVKDIPKTGDKSLITIWIMLIVISLLGILSAAKRKEDENENL